MAREITTLKLQYILNWEAQTDELYDNYLSMRDNNVAEVKRYAQEIRAEKVMAQLRLMPVEDLAKQYNGIRIKALRDKNYNTLADIAAASVNLLSSIYGISSTSAVKIKDAVKKVISDLEGTTKIRLSADERSTASTRLIQALYKCRNVNPLLDQYLKLWGRYRKAFRKSVIDVSPYSNGVRWVFASKKKKEEAIDKYKGFMQGCQFRLTIS